MSGRTKELRVASCWSQELVLGLLCALPLLSTVNGSKALQSVLKEHREQEMQCLDMLPKVLGETWDCLEILWQMWG